MHSYLEHSVLWFSVFRKHTVLILLPASPGKHPPQCSQKARGPLARPVSCAHQIQSDPPGT